jgi:hypothetical protein
MDETAAWRKLLGASTFERRVIYTYDVVPGGLGIYFIVFRDARHLESDLDETPREVLDRDQLAERGLEDRLQVTFSSSYEDWLALFTVSRTTLRPE